MTRRRPDIIEHSPCPACVPDLQCVACFLDTQAMRQLEEAHVLTLEGYAATEPAY